MKRSVLVYLAGGLLVCLPYVQPAYGNDPQPETTVETAATGDEWSEERRRADPEGYFAFVRQKFDAEAEILVPACGGLKRDIERQNEAIQAKMDLWRKAKEVAETF